MTETRISWARIMTLFLFFASLACKTKKELNASGQANPNGVSVRAFGAIADDGKDDSAAIQSAVDAAIRSGWTEIHFEPGIYDLQRGIVLAKQIQNGEFGFITFRLTGVSPAYSSNPQLGRSTVLKYHGDGFTLAVQSARNVVIENIMFEGEASLLSSAEEISKSSLEDWSARGAISINRFSPHCAVAIDPFHRNVPSDDRYQDMSRLYTNGSNGGSSMLTIKGCSFYRYYIAVANNPSNGVANGDNIRAENCHVSNCHTFWSAGQTQSRNNSIENIYALFLHTFVSGVQIGKQQGTPPFISNVNVAGYCEQVFNVQTLFSGLSIQQSYLESVRSLGIALVNSVSFSDSQIQFRIPDADVSAPAFHLYSNAPVHFQNCGLEFFDNCKTPAPFMLKAGALRISGGWIEGGIVAANGITNAGGEEIHHVTLENVFMKCKGSIAGRSHYIRPLENLAGHIFLGGESIQSNDGSVFRNAGNKYEVISLGPAEVDVDAGKGTATFINKRAGTIQIGDNLFTDRNLSLTDPSAKVYSIRPSLGYVKSINGNQISVAGLPEGMRGGNMEIYVVDYPIFIPPVWGDVQEGSSKITNVIAYAPSFYPKSGTRMHVDGFPNGAYVTEADPVNRTITLSAPAKQSQREIFIQSAGYTQEIYLRRWEQQQVPVMREGAVIHLEEPWNDRNRYINTSKAVLNSSHQPRLKAVE